jgi:hypothetical protein
MSCQDTQFMVQYKLKDPLEQSSREADPVNEECQKNVSPELVRSTTTRRRSTAGLSRRGVAVS